MNYFNSETLDKLNDLRERYGKPIILNSAYRCFQHNVTLGATQTHASGQAVDIKCSHKEAFNLVRLAIEVGFTGIGVSQKGSSRFIHVDDLTELNGRPRPHIWSY
jgi:zinc D-Ala-D-Ala carboxypeptidase